MLAAVATAAATAALLSPGPAEATGGDFTVGLKYLTDDTIEVYSDQWSTSAIDDRIVVTVDGGQLRVHNGAADVTSVGDGCAMEAATGDALCSLDGITDLYVRLGWGDDEWDSTAVALDVEVTEQSPSDPNSRVIRTGGGNDLVYGGYSTNRLVTGGGNDQVRPGSGADSVVQAGAGNDHIVNDGRRQVLDGGPGSDVIQTFCGDWQAGSVLEDTGTTGVDTIDARYVLDPVKIVGTAKGTMRCALRGAMTKATVLRGRLERIRLGNDYLGDTVNLASMETNRGRLTWYLNGGDDTFTGPSAGFPVTVVAGAGDDLSFTGPPSKDLVNGGDGNDQLVDQGGRDDELRGGPGRDGLGGRDRKADLLNGGNGRDFCFTSPDWARCDGVDRKVSIESR
jgi:hypothetical protein